MNKKHYEETDIVKEMNLLDEIYFKYSIKIGDYEVLLLDKFHEAILDYKKQWKDERERAGLIISQCKTKLQLYRADVDGEYLGGTEYTQLMKEIDNYFEGVK